MKSLVKRTAWELLVWTYRVQRVDAISTETYDDIKLLTGRGFSQDGCITLARVASVGCDIDGGQWKHLNNRVHPDALAVKIAVTSLPEPMRGIVERFANLAEQPRPCDVMPIASHVTPDQSRDEWEPAYRLNDRGEKIFLGFHHKVICVGHARERIPIWRGRGKKRKKDGYRAGPKIAIMASPIQWNPSREYVNWLNADAREFAAGVELMMARLASVRLRETVLDGAGLEFDPATITPPIPEPPDPTPRVAVDFTLARGGVIYGDEKGWKPLIRRARATLKRA